MNEKNEKKELVAYARVSTTKQKNDKTIETQKFEITNFENNPSNDYNIAQWFEDDGISGKLEREERDAYNRMIQYLEVHPEIHGIIVSNYDRLGRDAFELKSFKKDMLRLGKKLIILDMNVDSTTKEGKLVLGIFDEVVDFIASGIKDRMWRGRLFKREMAKKGLIEYKEGRKTINTPKSIKDKMINWYQKNKMGFRAISRLLQTEPIIINMQDAYKAKKKQLKCSPGWVRNKLIEWQIEIRSPNARKTGKKIDYNKIMESNLNEVK